MLGDEGAGASYGPSASGGGAPIAICFSIDAGFAMPLAGAPRSPYRPPRPDALAVLVPAPGRDGALWGSIGRGLTRQARALRSPVDPARVGAVQAPSTLPAASFVRLLM